MSGTETDREAQEPSGMRVHRAAAFSRKRPKPATQDEIATQAENLAYSLSGWADWEDGAPEPLLRKTAAFLRKHYAPAFAPEHPSDTKAAEIIRKAAARIEELLPVEVGAGLPAAWREACAAICDRAAEANRRAAVEMGEALGDEAARKDERVISLWAAVHEAEELAAQIREIGPLDAASAAPQATEEPVALPIIVGWHSIEKLAREGSVAFKGGHVVLIAASDLYGSDIARMRTPAAQDAPFAWAYEFYSDSQGRWFAETGRTDPKQFDSLIRNIRPLYAAPAASRIGVSQEEIRTALEEGICSSCRRDCVKGVTPAYACEHFGSAGRCSWAEPTVEDQTRRLLALLAAPRAGGETGDSL